MGETKGACGIAGCRLEALPALYRLVGGIAECADLKEILAVLMDILETHMGVVRGMVTLHHRSSGTIITHSSIGLNLEEKARGIYTLGEGVTGKVVETGKPMVVPTIRGEPSFLNRTLRRNEAELDNSFLCIPMVRGKSVLGAISAEKRYSSREELDADLAFLTFVAGILAQAVDLYLFEYEDKTYWERENNRLKEALKEKFHPANIIGNSASMRDVYGMIEKITGTRVTVLLLGESGVGKELVANAIHYHSACAGGPFVKFNCAALPESLVESELFGHEKGAFTGADSIRKGRFEEADGGTIFLDEVGELSLAAQAKLLRVLQERTFERVGGSRSIGVNIRIIAATNQDLDARVREGKFREDLYFRLHVFPITIPPLRDRGGDVITLADHFIAKFSKENGKAVKRISAPAIQMLMNHSWPGNVRELENVIERAVILCDDETIHAYNLPPSLQTATISGSGDGSILEAKLEAVEYEYIVEALRNNSGNMSLAARDLGLTRRVLGLRMKKFSIDFMDYRKRILGKPGQEPLRSPQRSLSGS